MVSISKSNRVTQREVLRWVVENGPYMPDAYHQCMMFYLSGHAFYREDNTEDAEIGQVFMAASYIEAIMSGTAIRSRSTVWKILNSLQDMGYLWRCEREAYVPSKAGQLPHEIHVLFEDKYEELRRHLRAGNPLPEPLQSRPRRPHRKAEVIDLRVVRDDKVSTSGGIHETNV